MVGPEDLSPEAWELPAWHGPDRASLAGPWAAKPKVAVGGLRSCAELAVLDRLARSGWRGVWVSAWGRKLRTGFPEPAYATISEAGAPPWAATVFDALLDANGGYSGFFDVFAWREPGEIG
jgi:hypothetical protein